MSNKINLSSVVKDHFSSLQNDATKKLSFLDVSIFLGIPAILFVTSVWNCFKLSDGAVVAMLTAMSVFSGLLINVLVLIYTVAQNIAKASERRTTSDIENEKRFLHEIFANITFAIIVSILQILILASTYLSGNERFQIYSTATTVFLLINFILTMLMVLKRLYLLLQSKVD
jgi:hypothetical protein